MKKLAWCFLVVLTVTRGWAADAGSVTIPVDAPAFVFSPGNWVGDAGRGGAIFRQAWNPGAYFRVTWESDATNAPVLLLDTSTYDGSFPPPSLACQLDGIWSGDVPAAGEIPLAGLDAKARRHTLVVHFKKSQQMKRWGTEQAGGQNVVRITGLRVAAGSSPVAEAPGRPWLMIVGDSITEGVGAYELEGYSHLVGQAFHSLGYEYAISACGWSGWLHRGDNPPGDVPGYYVVTNSANGVGGQYLESHSRWNRIDARHSLLDARGRISAYGGTDEEPAAILINYGTNDAIHPTDASDVRASIRQALPALRRAAPRTHLFILIPFGQYRAAELKEAVAAFRAAHPEDRRITIIDLGPAAARALMPKKGYWGDLHPNARAHATFAAQIVPQMVKALDAAP